MAKKKKTKYFSHTDRKVLFILLTIVLVFVVYDNRDFLFGIKKTVPETEKNYNHESLINRTEHNYGKEIDRLAGEFGLPAAYLKALVALECSGMKPPGTRFERHVFKRLKKLRDGKISKMENLKMTTVKNVNDDGLKNLATSWGPFQLMGYKCVILGIYVVDIRGDNSLYWGIKWIDLTYGSYLRKGRYRDAFHMHNTGDPFPSNGKSRTFDPDYVDRGLSLMKQFEQLK
ncbi:MAG: hypothetical protein A2W91_00870 [Bacteroidetes bacterium GWF2_38_335]|nr:MAG: hypothetical protein A2W91_00870 [Bacteroidetes bacterium GWF2_38_335]OFY80307.1 MAG: hypothetical protein A2281_17380 [Bacteroidetes bacterium RIFOXYA12_FULL_38_20]HBS88893.1 hypothetical protein [Bacteroidales bacterium]